MAMQFHVDIFDPEIYNIYDSYGTHVLNITTSGATPDDDGFPELGFFFHSLEALEAFGLEIARYVENAMREAME